MTAQVSQIQLQAPEFSLFQDSYASNASDHSFQNYLEEEQKRWGQFNFDSWFSYPVFQPGEKTSGNYLYSPELEVSYQLNTNENKNQSTPAENLPLSNQLPGDSLMKPTQTVLRELLLKSGWLIPNLEASPLLSQAQLDGKLLNKLDLQFLVDQILSQVKLVGNKDKIELLMGLKPENMGEIFLSVSSRSGLISIQIQATEETRKLIEAQLLELKLALKKANINLEEIKIFPSQEINKHV
ncbi:hypothetical protein A3F86_03500 [candidate division WOR-1 bacterium RIFCSPLOWO2_12_FULL_45_9]|uniref:Flagellar hook-length control protein-like C-terminal domain-containing protein n=1 Tax=candidate division WOR-1 bacterium RIFCSPLOWO2_12_FULL_45_9 TaxID=1802568 RepID=A0A1F4RML3_UNCSA|nr:MAG: hypothetical protein A3F86_03500 [candidate division WOR-1 bacterium RIFCSPLOWO2_12_FULL_45_9]